MLGHDLIFMLSVDFNNSYKQRWFLIKYTLNQNASYYDYKLLACMNSQWNCLGTSWQCLHSSDLSTVLKHCVKQENMTNKVWLDFLMVKTQTQAHSRLIIGPINSWDVKQNIYCEMNPVFENFVLISDYSLWICLLKK